MRTYLISFTGYMLCDVEGEEPPAADENMKVGQFMSEHVAKLNPAALIDTVVVLDEGLVGKIRTIQAQHLGIKLN